MATGKPVLVAYASKYGSTAGIADQIGESFKEAGIPSEVRLVGDVTDVSGYRGVVIGSPVYVGKWLPEAVQFVQARKGQLSAMPVAYFTAGLTLEQKPEEGRKEHQGAIDQVRQAAPEVEPIDVGMFSGSFDPKNVNLLMRLFLKLNKAPKGDFRDWEAIKQWALSVKSKMQDGG